LKFLSAPRTQPTEYDCQRRAILLAQIEKGDIALLVAECHIELEASDNSSAPVNVDQPQTIGALSLAASCLGGHFHDRAAGMPIHPTKIRKNNPVQSSSLRKSATIINFPNLDSMWLQAHLKGHSF
jgi:hypothetical protein